MTIPSKQTYIGAVGGLSKFVDATLVVNTSAYADGDLNEDGMVTFVDFGIWKHISPSELMMPLDVHTGTVSRKLGLLKRAQNDWKAVEELTQRLRSFDPADPVKYDFALFGIGAFEGKAVR